MAAAALELSSPSLQPMANIEDLGIFGAMALLAVIQTGGDAGFRHYCAWRGSAARLAPHSALRHRMLMTLLNSGVLAPAGSKRRIDDAMSEAHWADASLDDADWVIVWDDVTRGSLPVRLRSHLDGFESTPRTREVLLDTWQALAVGECLAFGEYALSSHNLNPALARSAAPVLPPILAQQSIGQGCALMWFAAKHLAAWFLRHGGGAPGAAERELMNSIHNNFDRAAFSDRPITTFTRHTAIPLSALVSVFMWTSRLGDTFWTLPVSELALEQVRPTTHMSA